MSWYVRMYVLSYVISYVIRDIVRDIINQIISLHPTREQVAPFYSKLTAVLLKYVNFFKLERHKYLFGNEICILSST